MHRPKQTSEERKKFRLDTIEKYLTSGLTQKQFCQQEQIAYSTFQLWLRNYRRSENRNNGTLSDKFVSLKVTPPEKQLDSPHYIFQYPNGVVVHVHGGLSPQTLLTLIQAG